MLQDPSPNSFANTLQSCEVMLDKGIFFGSNSFCCFAPPLRPHSSVILGVKKCPPAFPGLILFLSLDLRLLYVCVYVYRDIFRY